ncbi:MAG: serine protease [Oscillospiraceae bacterium]|nr:serine protease [Oscillospiraceae bacterium]
MTPISISEKLMYNTVRLETLTGSCGTGFFFNFRFDDTIVPTIITNKHVVDNNPDSHMKFFLHLGDDSGNDIGENFRVTYAAHWYFHPTHDICFTFVNPVFEEVKKRTGKNVIFCANDENLIYNKKQLEELTALEDVVMVGYPTGLWDQLHNYPIFRKGLTATHPGYDFNQKSVGLVDIACFPGSSGSPIYILDENGYTDKRGNTYLGAKRFIFLGILYAGPTITVNGEVSVVDIPTTNKVISQSRVMVNLGYYIKSYEILEFKPIIKEIMSS